MSSPSRMTALMKASSTQRRATSTRDGPDAADVAGLTGPQTASPQCLEVDDQDQFLGAGAGALVAVGSPIRDRMPGAGLGAVGRPCVGGACRACVRWRGRVWRGRVVGGVVGGAAEDEFGDGVGAVAVVGLAGAGFRVVVKIRSVSAASRAFISAPTWGSKRPDRVQNPSRSTPHPARRPRRNRSARAWSSSPAALARPARSWRSLWERFWFFAVSSSSCSASGFLSAASAMRSASSSLMSPSANASAVRSWSRSLRAVRVLRRAWPREVPSLAASHCSNEW